MGVRLPAEYQEVEFITANGQQYFWSNVLIQDGLTVDAIQSFAGGDSYLFGGHADNTGNNRCSFSGTYSSSVQSAYPEYFFVGRISNDGTVFHVITTFKDGHRTIYIDGVNVFDDSRGTAVQETGKYCVVFGQRSRGNDTPGTVSNLYHGSLYSLKVSKNSVLLADYVPCYRKVDNKPGMYDLVTGTFFVNQRTSDDFIVGPDVIDHISPLMVAWRRGLMMRKPFDCPYVKDGLVFWLDGIRKGDDPTVWKDLVSGITFDMSGVTFTTDGVEFVSGSYGAYDGNIAVAWNVGTIEACVNYAPSSSTILSQRSYSPTPFSLILGGSSNVGYAQDGNSRPRAAAMYGWKTLSVNADSVVRNGTSVGFGMNDSWGVNIDNYTYLGIRNSALSTYRFTGTMYSIRIYNRKLTEQEMIFNQSVDNARFNLGLSI